VGPLGLLQPIADVLKLLLKEVIQPTQASRWIYLIAPIMTVVPAFAVWSVIPFQAKAVLGDINAGLLYVMAISSVGVYGVILAGWASNSKYAFLGAMRAAAQMVSYEISMGFALVVVLMVTGSLNMSAIVVSQEQGIFASWGINFLSWNWLPLLPMFVVYFVSGIAERTVTVRRGGRRVGDCRRPHDRLFGHGIRTVLPRRIHQHDRDLGDRNHVVPCGWSAPFGFLSFIPGIFWFVLKIFFLLSVFIWARATFPRYRYDQIMRLGWKIFLPVSVVWVGRGRVLDHVAAEHLEIMGG